MEFQSLFSNELYKQNLNLRDYSSMKTGGNADHAFFPQTEADLLRILIQLKKAGLPYHIIGNASNVLFPDEGLHSAVIFTVGMKGWHLCHEDLSFAVTETESVLYAECGVSLTPFALAAAKLTLTGLEFAYGIPGTVGGAVYMNAGAYDGEIKNIVRAVTYLDTATIEKGVYLGEENRFGYRESIYSQEGAKVILGAYFVLQHGVEADIRKKALGFLASRKEKQPLEYPSCGSTFKRPIGCYAGKLIEEAGLKNAHVGDACISEKHAGFLINEGNATTKDILALMELVQKTVKEQSGVMLEPEIKLITDQQRE